MFDCGKFPLKGEQCRRCLSDAAWLGQSWRKPLPRRARTKEASQRKEPSTMWQQRVHASPRTLPYLEAHASEPQPSFIAASSGRHRSRSGPCGRTPLHSPVMTTARQGGENPAATALYASAHPNDNADSKTRNGQTPRQDANTASE